MFVLSAGIKSKKNMRGKMMVQIRKYGYSLVAGVVLGYFLAKVMVLIVEIFY